MTSPSGSRVPIMRVWALCLTAAFVFAIVEHVQAYLVGSDFSFAEGFIRMQRPWLLLGVLAPLAVALAGRWPFERARWKRSLAIHAVASFAFAYGHLALLSMSDRVFFRVTHPLFAHTAQLAGFYLIQNLFVYWTLVAATNAWRLHSALLRRERDAAELRSHLAEARLEALQRQIQPHFLFNTLNTVSMLARKGDNRAVVKVIADLSGLLRYSLGSAPPIGVPLSDEVAFLQRYLDIERLRFSGRLNVSLSIQSGTETALVPTLILQPLVENAVRHGLSRIASQAELSIRALRDADALVLEVTDNGTGLADAPDHRGGAGIGLRNVAERLDAVYGGRAALTVEPRTGGGTVARVTLPFVAAGAEPAMVAV